MDTMITSSEMKINDDANGGCGSSTIALFQRDVEFHKARKPFNGIGMIGGERFKIETINPTKSDPRKQGAGSKADGFDLELSFGITFKRIGAGLENLGNTCFLNSVLQCLTYTEPLVAYLQSGKHKNSCHIAGFCALCAMQKHVSRALQLTGRSLAPKDLVSNLRCISRNFRNSRQEDAHEYMVNLLESMHKCCLPSGVPTESSGAYEKSLVHKIFGGRLRSRVKCTQCSYCSDKFDPFLDLSLEILKADSLQKALLNFTADELLDGGEKHYQCQRCKQKVRALKQLKVDKSPHVLTIHLKRFRSYDGQKIDKKVVFGSTLDMKPFVSGSDGGDLKYTLYGVLVHYGWSNRSGHYSCFIRTSTGMWYSLDDNQVGQVNERTVMNQKAYMLFYVRDRKKLLPRKPVDILQKENLKEHVNAKKICSIVNQHSNQLAQNPQNNKYVMAESSKPKDDSNVKPTLIENNPSGTSNKTEKLPLSGPSVNKNSSNHENSTITGHSKINDCQVNEIPENMSGVSVIPIYNGLQNFTGDKPDTSVTLRKGSTVSHDEVSKILLPDGTADKTTERLPRSDLSANITPERLPIESSCDQDQAGGIFSANSNLVKEKVTGIDQNALLESVALSASTVTKRESLYIKPQNTTTQKKPKKNSSKRHIASIHVGLKLFKPALVIRKKTHSVSTDHGPSTSEKSLKISLVSSQSRKKHRKKSDFKSDGDSSKTMIDGDFNKRQKQNGVVLATKQLQQCASSIREINQHNASEPLKLMDGKLIGKVRKHIQGLQETVVPRWDNTETPFLTAEVIKSTSIGYVLDKWDEELDAGKRKKVKQSKPISSGPNPFQEISTNRNKSKSKKARINRASFSNQPFRIYE